MFRAVPLRPPEVFFKDVAGLKASVDADRRQARSGEGVR
jgi:hypothetical protein